MINSQLRLLLIAAAAVLTLLSTPLAWAIDMTGTWDGKLACKSFGTLTGGITQSLTVESVSMQISDNLGDLNIHVSGFAVFQMDGVRFDDAKKPATKGRAGFANCANDGQVAGGATDEVWDITVSEGGGKAKFKGTRFDAASNRVVTCKVTFDRISVINPLVAACP